jgi:hypothetical protein
VLHHQIVATQQQQQQQQECGQLSRLAQLRSDGHPESSWYCQQQHLQVQL